MGGNAVVGVGTIHILEIAPTLRQIERDLGFRENDLDGRILGSVGKKEYSGDIDLVFATLPSNEMMEFFTNLKKVYGQDKVRKNGNMCNVAVPIVDFNATFIDRLPRTGTVQVDFVFGEEEFTRLFNYSPGDTSKYKGVHRNIALSAVASWIDRKESAELDNQGRPIEKIRWKWGPAGFFKIKRYSRKDKNGDWIKTQSDEQIGSVKYDPKLIAEIMFGDGAEVSDLNSLESIIEACKRSYDKEQQEKVFDTFAYNLIDYNKRSPKTNLSSYGVPIEIQPFMDKYDK